MPRRDFDEWWLRIESEMQRLSGEIAAAGPKVARHKGWTPRVDVLEGPRHVLIKAELSGVRGERIRLYYNAERHSILLRGERIEDVIPAEECWVPHQLEIDYGEFAREIPLPDIRLNMDEVRAQYRNGMLRVAIPKVGAETGTVVETKIRIEQG